MSPGEGGRKWRGEEATANLTCFPSDGKKSQILLKFMGFNLQKKREREHIFLGEGEGKWRAFSPLPEEKVHVCPFVCGLCKWHKLFGGGRRSSLQFLLLLLLARRRRGKGWVLERLFLPFDPSSFPPSFQGTRIKKARK